MLKNIKLPLGEMMWFMGHNEKQKQPWVFFDHQEEFKQ